MIRLPHLAGLPSRPLAAVGIAAALLVAVVLAAALLIAEIVDRSGEIDAARDTLAGLVARSRDHGPRTARIERLVTNDPHLVGETEVLAANGLQRHVMAVAADGRLRVRTIARDESRTDQAGLAIVALRIELDGRLEDFQKFVYRLETEMPFLLIDTLTLRPVPPTAEDSEIGGRIVADLTIVGFRRPKEG